MRQIYVTWKISKDVKTSVWYGHMEVSAPYDWDVDEGKIPWIDKFDFKAMTSNGIHKKINAKLYELHQLHQHKYPIQLVFPSSAFENTDWA